MLAALQAWMSLDEGIEVSEIQYQSPQWNQPRRMVVVRQKIKDRPMAGGKTLRLFKDEECYRQYRYTACITNLTLSAPDVWRLYRGRADSENPCATEPSPLEHTSKNRKKSTSSN